MRKEDIRRLKELTEMAWIANSHRLRRKLAVEQALVAKLSDLSSARDQCMRDLTEQVAPDSGMIRATTGWMKWSELERRKLNMELARSKAELAAEREQARSTFGRREAVRQISDSVEKQRKTQNDRARNTIT